MLPYAFVDFRNSDDLDRDPAEIEMSVSSDNITWTASTTFESQPGTPLGEGEIFSFEDISIGSYIRIQNLASGGDDGDWLSICEVRVHQRNYFVTTFHHNATGTWSTRSAKYFQSLRPHLSFHHDDQSPCRHGLPWINDGHIPNLSGIMGGVVFP